MAWKKAKKDEYWNENGCRITSRPAVGPDGRKLKRREWDAYRANGDLLITAPTMADAKRACEAEPGAS